MITSFFSLLCEKSNIPEDAIKRALGFSEIIDVSPLSRLFFEEGGEYTVTDKGVLCFKDVFFPHRFFNALTKQLRENKIPCETGFLYAYLLLSKEGFERHTARGLDGDVYFDTVKTVATAVAEYRTDTGNFGIYDYHFLSNHIRGNILRLGSFEYVCSDYEDKPSIIMHVPTGADFSKQARLNSYSLAREYFGNDRPIVADTWLLYEALSDMLPCDSNILSFAEDFSCVQQNEESCDYSELFHVFGRLGDFSYENLPQETTLQKAFAERVKKNLPIGSGVGELKY